MAMGLRNQKNKKIDGLSRREKKPEESFYRDLDAKNSSFLGFWVLTASILLLIFIALVWLAVYFKRDINSSNLEDNTASENLVSFSERLSGIKGDGHAVLIFRGEEFAKAIGALDDNFLLAGANFEIKKDSVYLKGRPKDSFIFWPVSLKILPEVKDQKFYFTLALDSLENIIIFSQDKEKIESTFDKNLNETLKAKGMIAEEIKTADGYIELHVIKEVK